MSIVLVVFCTLLITLRLLQHKFHPNPELVRKLFHTGMGLFTLSLPWLFTESWPVLVMCGVIVSLLCAMRWIEVLHRLFGSVLGGVARCSHGEIYFSIGVAILFVLTRDDQVVYLAAILPLTLADSAAALIGKRFGKNHYQWFSKQKSIEGSLTFLIVAIACIYAPLSTIAKIESATAVLIAITAGLVLTLIEAICLRGLDNLFIPLAAYFLLSDLRSRTNDELILLLLIESLITIAFTFALIRKIQIRKHRKAVTV